MWKNKRNKKVPEEYNTSMEEFEKMLQEFEEDKKKHDFSIPPQWDEDFRKTMNAILHKKAMERRKHRLVKAAELVLMLGVCGGMLTTEVDGIEIVKHFQNTIQVSNSNHDIHGTAEQIELQNEITSLEVYYTSATLDELFSEIHADLKIPMFYVKDVFPAYEIYEAKYNQEFKYLTITLNTEYGYININQEFLFDNNGSGTLHENTKISSVSNDSLSQTIKIYQNTENNIHDNYYFSVSNEYCKLVFDGILPLDICENIAQNIYYE